MVIKKVDYYLISNQVTDAKYKLASRLSNKLLRLKQKTLVVTDDKEQCENLDRIMWSFNDTSFVAHDHLNQNSTPSKINISPIKEVTLEALSDDFNVLINLSNTVPDFSDQFTRIAEIVESDESAKALARQRFKLYKKQGFELNTHTIEL